MDLNEDALQRLKYALSVPERTLRSLAALVGGTTLLLTETLFPESLKGTTLFRVFIGDTQNFLVAKVAQMQQQGQVVGQPAQENYLPRKALGSALESAGLLAIHFSPLWVFAIAGDAAAGSKTFLTRLVFHLKQNGVIPQDADPQELSALLQNLQASAQSSTMAIDTPPLSRADIEKLSLELSTRYGMLFQNMVDLLPRIDLLWERMLAAASKEKLTLEALSGILTVDLSDLNRKTRGAAAALGTTGSELVGENILNSYARTLDGLNEEGAGGYVRRHMQPFLKAAADHFAPDAKTSTEEWLRDWPPTSDSPDNKTSQLE